jgi:hypothetical protein
MIFSEYISEENPLKICPKFLLEEHFGKQALDYIPVDTGIEIECNMPDNWEKNWLNLPNIIENSSSSSELRLRIPPGLSGFKLVWDICEHLNSQNYILTQSAIHFHIDITGHIDNIKKVSEDKNLLNFCESELLKWDHVHEITGTAFNFFKKSNTIEIRCGKMTFDYQEMIKDIIWSHYIVKYIKEYASNIEMHRYVNMLKSKKELELKAKDLIKNKVVKILL